MFTEDRQRLQRLVDANALNFTVRFVTDVPGDGDCLFSSISVHSGHNPHLLRKVVAKSVLYDHGLRDTAFEFWQDVCASSLGDEFDFFRPFCGNKIDVEILSRRMMDRSLYWGDHYALQVLSQIMQRTIVVLSHFDSVAKIIPPVQRHCMIVIWLYDDHYRNINWVAKTQR